MNEYLEKNAVLACFHDWIDKNGDVHTADEMPEYRAIEALPSAGGWIPCNEKIPQKAVLCCDTCGGIIIGCIYEDNGSDSGYTAINDTEMLYYNHGLWCKPDGLVFTYEVLAWYPLPKKPYKEKRMMTLDEAIVHCEEVADYDCYNDKEMKCANEHRQLAEWLKEYKELKSLQTAKKPKWKAEDRFVTNRFQQFPYCPHCGYEITTGDCHCRVCGQHIDWDEDDV